MWRPIAAAIIGAIAKTSTRATRISDCTKANIRPRTSFSTSIPSIVKPVTHESPANAPRNRVKISARTRFETSESATKKAEETVSATPKIRRLENWLNIFGPSAIPRAKPVKTEPKSTP